MGSAELKHTDIHCTRKPSSLRSLIQDNGVFARVPAKNLPSRLAYRNSELASRWGLVGPSPVLKSLSTVEEPINRGPPPTYSARSQLSCTQDDPQCTFVHNEKHVLLKAFQNKRNQK
ncbi:UNVERIFIED_CONTAM: hypothetical protein FKN15_022688 [Acipenser sinensis]